MSTTKPPLRANSLEQQKIDAEARVAEVQARIDAWEASPEGKAYRVLEAEAQGFEKERNALDAAYHKAREEVGARLGVCRKGHMGEWTAAFKAKVLAHVGLTAADVNDLPQANESGRRRDGTDLVRTVTNEIASAIIDAQPEVQEAKAAIDAHRKVANEHSDRRRRAWSERGTMESDLYRARNVVQEIVMKIRARDVKKGIDPDEKKPETPAEKKAREEREEKLREAKNELVRLAGWARRGMKTLTDAERRHFSNRDVPPEPSKPFTWED
jgi:hypothetical protein